MTGLNVGVSRGATSYHNGTSMPQARPGCLSETHTLFVCYRPNAVQGGAQGTQHRVDHSANVRSLIAQAGELFKITVVASSAVIGVAGSGHLALGYPTTSTFTQATSPEETTIQLRTYLGSYISSRESILVLPNVFIDGVVSIENVTANHQAGRDDTNRVGLDVVEDGMLVFDAQGAGAGNEVGRVYVGTTYADATAPEPLHVNQGPLGILDKINGLATIQGGISTMPMEL